MTVSFINVSFSEIDGWVADDLYIMLMRMACVTKNQPLRVSHEKGALFQEGQLGLILVTEVSLNSNKGWFHGKKVVVFFILSKLPPLPLIWTTCTTFFERQKRRFKRHSNIWTKIQRTAAFFGMPSLRVCFANQVEVRTRFFKVFKWICQCCKGKA